MRTRETLVINEKMEEAIGQYGRSRMPGTETRKSAVYVPLVVGDQARGVINSVDMEREHAFSESDVRLLQTLANSMSVALENARLFDETQRLLKETEQRAAELAVINSIQEGIAAELDFQAIVDLVGDKLRGVFHTGDIGIRWYDPKTNLNHFLYQYERGMRMTCAAEGTFAGGREAPPDSRVPMVVNNRAEYAALGFQTTPGTDQSESSIAVPIVGSDRVSGLRRHRGLRARERVRRVRSPPAHDDNGEHGRRARERAAVRRDAAAAQGDRAAQRRARDRQQRPEGPARRSSTSRRSSTWSATRSPRSSARGYIYMALHDRATNLITMPYYLEHGERFRSSRFRSGSA